MTYILEKADTLQQAISLGHPLEPLTADEIKVAVATARSARSLSHSVRFMSVGLQEPPKDFVQAYRPGDLFDRQAFMVLLDNAAAKTYEAVISITHQTVVSWQSD